MAKQSTTPKNDPAALAFSAVENALKDSILNDDSQESSKKKTNKPNDKKPANTRDNVAQKIANKTKASANDSKDKISLGASAANRNDASNLLYKLQNKSSSAPFWVATLFSLLWLSGTGFVAWLRYGEQITNIAKLVPFTKTIEFTSLLAIALLPVLGFFALAILVRRAADLRLAANSMTEVAIRLAQPESYAVDKIATVAQAVRREVNALGDGLDRALTRAGELEVMVHNEVTSLENTYANNETRLRSLIEELSAQRDSVITNSDRVRDAIAQAHTLMIEDMDNASSSLSSAITSHSQDAVQSLQQNTNLLETSFHEKSENFITLMDNRTTDLLSSIDMSSEKLELTLNDGTTSIENSFGNRTQELSTILDDRLLAMSESFSSGVLSISQSIDLKSNDLSSSLEQSGSVVIAQLETSAQSASASLEAVGTRVSDDLDQRTNSLEQMISATTDRLDETLSIKFNTMDSRLNTSIIQIGAATDEAGEQFSKILDESGKENLASLNARTDEISLILSSRIKEMDDIIGVKGEKIIISLNTHTNDFNSGANLLTIALDEKTALLNESLSSKTSSLSSSIEQKTSLLDKTLLTHTKALSSSFNDQSEQLSKTIDVQVNEVRSHTNNAVRSISETMQMRTKDMGDVVTSKIEQVNEDIGKQVDNSIARLADAESGLNNRIDIATSSIEESTEKTAKIIETGVDAARQAIVEMVDDRLGTLPEAITARADITADRLTALSDDINSSITQSMSDLETSATKIEETIGTSLASVSVTISNDVEQTAARMDITVRSALDQVKEAARHIEDLVEVRALETAKTLETKVEQMNEAITSQTNNFASIISDKSQELDNTLKGHSNILINALGQSSAEAEELMSASTGRILVDVNEALKKLNDSNLFLQRVLETSSTNLSEMETSVANHTSSYANVVKEAVLGTKQAGEMVGEHVNAFQTTIQSVTSEFGTMLNELNEQTQSINQASTNLDNAGNSTIDNLKDRELAMSELAKSFTSRADEIDVRMHSFASNIASTISETEQRLETAQKAMQESLNSSTINVANRLDKFNDATDQLGTEATEKLQSVQDGLVSEMNAALQNATNRFNQTANEMRSTANQVNDELEATRTELQRSMNDLPEETRTSAAAMRRVVAEQIEALNELNSIVRNQRSTNDISASRLTKTERSIPTPAPQAYALPTQTSQAHTSQAHAPQAHVLQENISTITQPVMKELAPEKAVSGNSSLAELLRKPNQDQQPQQEELIPRVDTNTNQKHKNWLSDVLRNASAKQEEAPQPEINLSNLTQEISNAVDNLALKDAWQRFQSGEANVFSRRIYTLSGQGTFDLLRSKLQKDVNFAQNSSAYINEFEQLLTKTIEDPNEKNGAIDLLTSEKGKIFTMLAHASGRLG